MIGSEAIIHRTSKLIPGRLSGEKFILLKRRKKIKISGNSAFGAIFKILKTFDTLIVNI